MFNYIYFPNIFNRPLLSFLTNYRNNDYIISSREWGTYLIIIQDEIFKIYTNNYANNSVVIDDKNTKEIIIYFNKLKDSYFPLPELKKNYII